MQAKGWRGTSTGVLPCGTQFLCFLACAVPLAYWAEFFTWPATPHFLGMGVPHPFRLSWVGWHGWHQSLGAIGSPVLPLLSRILKTAQCPDTSLSIGRRPLPAPSCPYASRKDKQTGSRKVTAGFQCISKPPVQCKVSSN